jgi:hypothetical protein
MSDLVVTTYAVAVAENLGWSDERLVAIKDRKGDPELISFIAQTLAEGDPFGRVLAGPPDWCEALRHVSSLIQPIT